MSYIDFVEQLMSEGATREAAELRAGAAYGQRRVRAIPAPLRARASRGSYKTAVPPDPGAENPYPGVGWHTRDHRWRAQIKSRGKTVYLGYHDTAELAREAVEVARRKRATR
jgi:hypothetical protein